jgi:hypothetical protein
MTTKVGTNPKFLMEIGSEDITATTKVKKYIYSWFQNSS